MLCVGKKWEIITVVYMGTWKEKFFPKLYLQPVKNAVVLNLKICICFSKLHHVRFASLLIFSFSFRVFEVNRYNKIQNQRKIPLGSLGIESHIIASLPTSYRLYIIEVNYIVYKIFYKKLFLLQSGNLPQLGLYECRISLGPLKSTT